MKIIKSFSCAAYFFELTVSGLMAGYELFRPDLFAIVWRLHGQPPTAHLAPM